MDPPHRSSEGDKDKIEPGYLILPLKPWTQYAIMVKTQLSASDEHQVHGAKSEIIYVRTNATSKPDSLLWRTKQEGVGHLTGLFIFCLVFPIQSVFRVCPRRPFPHSLPLTGCCQHVLGNKNTGSRRKLFPGEICERCLHHAVMQKSGTSAPELNRPLPPTESVVRSLARRSSWCLDSLASFIKK